LFIVFCADENEWGYEDANGKHEIMNSFQSIKQSSSQVEHLDKTQTVSHITYTVLAGP